MTHNPLEEARARRERITLSLALSSSASPGAALPLCGTPVRGVVALALVPGVDSAAVTSCALVDGLGAEVGKVALPGGAAEVALRAGSSASRTLELSFSVQTSPGSGGKAKGRLSARCTVAGPARAAAQGEEEEVEGPWVTKREEAAAWQEAPIEVTSAALGQLCAEPPANAAAVAGSAGSKAQVRAVPVRQAEPGWGGGSSGQGLFSRWRRAGN